MDGGTALQWACAKGPLSVVPAQVHAGADLSLICEHGQTPLMDASDGCHVDIVTYLLEVGADPTIPAGEMSPLNIATRFGRRDIVALLGAAMAEPDRARALHKARALLEAGHTIDKGFKDAHEKGLSRAAH